MRYTTPNALSFTALMALPLAILFSGCGKTEPNTIGGNQDNNGGNTNTTVVTPFAGGGKGTDIDGNGSFAAFNNPISVAIDGLGHLYVADANNDKIRSVSATAVVGTFAGTGAAGDKDGTVATATFDAPYDVATDALGDVFVADLGNGAIRQVNAAGVVSTLTTAIGAPITVTVDPSGNVYAADATHVYKISSTGVATVFAGSDAAGAQNGTGAAASFNNIKDIVADSNGNIYVADSNNSLIRKITPDGTVTTIAGTGTAGKVNATGTAASFAAPGGIALDGTGNIYVADTGNNLIRKITTAGVVTTAAGSGVKGGGNGNGTIASFNSPTGIAVDGIGNLYVSDKNNVVRKITFN